MGSGAEHRGSFLTSSAASAAYSAQSFAPLRTTVLIDANSHTQLPRQQTQTARETSLVSRIRRTSGAISKPTADLAEIGGSPSIF